MPAMTKTCILPIVSDMHMKGGLSRNHCSGDAFAK